MTKEKVDVHFTHPRGSMTFTAMVSLQCTREQAIQGLITGDNNGSFLEPSPPGRPYELAIKRTSQVIYPNMTFEQAGVVDGDVIEVRQAGQGAEVYGQFQAEEQE